MPLLSLFAIAVAATVARLPLFDQIAYMAPNPVPFSDATVWELWSRDLWVHGLDDLSKIEPRTYVGYHYVFWAVGQVYALMSPDFEIGTPTLLYLVKVPPVIFDLLLIPLIYAATRRAARLLPDGLDAARRVAPVRWLEGRGVAAEDTLGIVAAAVFVLSPAVIYNSAVWAQSESVISFFMLVAVLALARGRVGIAWALWAIAFVIKPQPVVIVPALAAFTYWRFGFWGVGRAALGGAAGGVLMLGYLVGTGNGPYIIDVYHNLFTTHDALISVNAWNLWWIGQQEADLRASDVLLSVGPLSLTVEAMSFLLLVLSTLVALAYMSARRNLVGLLVACAMLEFAFYLFPISTHERYLYPFFVFLAPVMLLQPRWLLAYAPLAVIFFFNCFFASPTDPDMSKAPLNSVYGYAAAMANVVCFVTIAAALAAQSVGAVSWRHVLAIGREAAPAGSPSR